MGANHFPLVQAGFIYLEKVNYRGSNEDNEETEECSENDDNSDTASDKLIVSKIEANMMNTYYVFISS